MSHSDITEQLTGFVARESNIADQALIRPDADLFDTGILDSLMAISLISFCQEQFDYDLNDVDFSEGGMRTIGGLAALIASGGEQQRSV